MIALVMHGLHNTGWDETDVQIASDGTIVIKVAPYEERANDYHYRLGLEILDFTDLRKESKGRSRS
jgi:hypothetical protein